MPQLTNIGNRRLVTERGGEFLRSDEFKSGKCQLDIEIIGQPDRTQEIGFTYPMPSTGLRLIDVKFNVTSESTVLGVPTPTELLFISATLQLVAGQNPAHPCPKDRAHSKADIVRAIMTCPACAVALGKSFASRTRCSLSLSRVARFRRLCSTYRASQRLCNGKLPSLRAKFGSNFSSAAAQQAVMI